MVELKKKSFSKWAKIAIVLILTITIISAYFWVMPRTSNSENYDERYKDSPEAAVNILPNGDVVGQSSYSIVPIERNGNVYILTGDVNRELVIQRSNILINGKGFTIGMEDIASNHQTITLSSVKNPTIKNVNIIGPTLQFPLSMPKTIHCKTSLEARLACGIQQTTLLLKVQLAYNPRI